MAPAPCLANCITSVKRDQLAQHDRIEELRAYAATESIGDAA